MSQHGSTFETLARLSARPGVQSTLVLSRADGAIIQSSGFNAGEKGSIPKEGAADVRSATAQDETAATLEGEQPKTSSNDNTKPEEIARAVFRYVSEASKLISATGSAEEVQLLRLRTKSHEIVIVPGCTENNMKGLCADQRKSTDEQVVGSA